MGERGFTFFFLRRSGNSFLLSSSSGKVKKVAKIRQGVERENVAKRARVGERTMIIVIASFFPPVVVAKVGGGERECEVGASQGENRGEKEGEEGRERPGSHYSFASLPPPPPLSFSFFPPLLFLSSLFPSPADWRKKKRGAAAAFPSSFSYLPLPLPSPTLFPNNYDNRAPFPSSSLCGAATVR